MKEFRWDQAKNQKLKATRGVSFEESLEAKFIALEKHHAKKNQKVMLFEYKEHVWVVPCIVEKEYTFLKTAFPSRKYTKNIIKRSDKK